MSVEDNKIEEEKKSKYNKRITISYANGKIKHFEKCDYNCSTNGLWVNDWKGPSVYIPLYNVEYIVFEKNEVETNEEN